MCDDRPVVLKRYARESDAEFARIKLESAGITAFVFTNDFCGWRPELRFVNGVDVVVRKGDVTAALEVLEAEAHGLEELESTASTDPQGPEPESHAPAERNGVKKYEYKIHYLKLLTGTPKEQQILDALNRFGGEGWRLNRLYGEFSLRSFYSWNGGYDLLLEREISE
jgi:hypothetical protein